ncbi:MAG: DNA polymerase I [Isosphaeraceae bacterium]|nr:DNA polymerase I [Isosphaeraceae bacterium]
MNRGTRTIYILDTYSLIYQVFHAIPTMTGPAGQPTNAVFGIFRDLLNLVRKTKPDYLAAAFEGGEPTKRLEILPEYKANRAAMPDDLRPQIEVIKRVVHAFRIPVLESEGAEADDVIATLARKAEAEGIDVVICTADKDARQLLSDRVRILNLRKNEFLDVDGLQRDWGIRPDQVVDLLALTGDSVDNVPGVPGIGIKTAATLLQAHETLDGILENLDKVTGAKRKQSLADHAETVQRGRRLIELDDRVPITIDWSALELGGGDARELKDLCIECGFHGFLKEIEDHYKPPKAAWDYSTYEKVDSPEALASLADRLRGLDRFAFDTETTSTDPLRAELVGLSFAWEEGRAAYVPVRGPVWCKTLPAEDVISVLGPILADPRIEKIGQNAKYDMLVLTRSGVDVAGPITDTMVLSYLLESGERNHGLNQLAERMLDHTMIPISDLIGKGKKQLRMDEVEVDRVVEYAAEDADVCRRIALLLEAEIEREGLTELYAELERPLIRILADMERAGIRIDVDRMNTLSREFGTRIDEIEGEIHRIAGRPFNIGSAQQLRKVLFEEIGLKPTKKTPGGEPSTDQEVLEELAALHELPRAIIEHRRLSKLKSTYLDALPALVHPDGRIHASFNQVVAATGRLSSSDPNLQNIPVRTEEGRQIRQAFLPGRDDWSLLTADYSQIELRILAHYSADPALVEAFSQGRDVHSVVASRIFGVAESAVTSEQRRVAKTVNFGVIYGLSAFGLAARLGITQSEAATFIDAYFEEYSGVDRFITTTLESALATGRVETILGRRRPIQGIKNTTGRSRNLAERTAVNTVIQGSAADLIKKAMIDVVAAIRDERLEARMLLQIHDELVFEAPTSEIPRLAPIVRRAMTEALELDVPLEVDLGFGANWLDVVEIA